MRVGLVVFLLMNSLCAFSQSSQNSDSNKNFQVELKRARDYFKEGKYSSTRNALNALNMTLKKDSTNKNLIGLVGYWTGLTANRQQEYADAIAAFEQALSVDYRPVDIYYEYGQALFAADKLVEARTAFRESVKRGYKRGVSLYYIGFISQTIKDFKRAITFYRAIQKLPLAEQDDTVQAAEMQIGDIYLEQAEKHPDIFKAIEKYVIPQYQKALELSPDSGLAGDIKAKIIDLQQKYELVLFRMRNGKPTSIPPYLLRLVQDFTYDTNPVFAATETTNSSALEGSMVSKTEAFGRYSFYIKDVVSISPELRTNYSRHLNRNPEIIRNDNRVIAPAIRTSYEHTLGKKPSSFLFDYDFVYTDRDIAADNKLSFNSRVHTYSVGERISGLFGQGETTFRARFRQFDSFAPTANSTTQGIAIEHIDSFKNGSLWIFNFGYDKTQVESEEFNANTLFLRADVIFPVWARFNITPQAGFGLTLTDPVNNPDRGLEQTIHPSFRLSKPVGKRYRVSLHVDYMQNDSKDTENFAYQKTFYGVEFEYLF